MKKNCQESTRGMIKKKDEIYIYSQELKPVYKQIYSKLQGHSLVTDRNYNSEISKLIVMPFHRRPALPLHLIHSSIDFPTSYLFS